MTEDLAPSAAEIDAEPDPVRRALLSAMRRLILGHPRHVHAGTGSLRDLAYEAEVGRHHLYRGHSDLADRFRYATKDDSGMDVSRARELAERAKAEVQRLKSLQNETRSEARRWKATAEVLQRAVNVLQEELRREQLKSARLLRRIDSNEGSQSTPVVLLRPRDDGRG